VLQRVDDVVADGRVVEHRDVPAVVDDDPHRHRDERVGEHPQPADARQGEDRAQHRAGQPDRDQERRDVPDQHVLDHVDRQPLVGLRGDRGQVGGDADRDARGDQREPPAGHGPALARQRPGTDGDDRREQVERRGLDQDGEDVRSGHQRSPAALT
jgi:hypothetical protein